MREQRVGFIGYGVVGQTFGQTMSEHGASVAYFDALGERGGTSARFCALPKLLAESDILVSAVVTQAALPVAQQVRGWLRPGQTYVDVNSTSPRTKAEIAATVAVSGAAFVEAAILGPIAADGARALILLCGPSAEQHASTLRDLGLSGVRYLSERYGDAATVKMLRSIFTKGVECVLLEMLTTARRAGLQDHMWEEIMGFLAESSFDRVADNWIRTHVMACDRRAHEVDEVLATMQELDVPAVMTSATQAFFSRSVALHPRDHFPAKPAGIDPVVQFFEERLHRGREGQSQEDRE